MEHRCGRRQFRQESVALTCGAGFAVIAQCHNVSASGAYVLTTLKPPLLAPIEVFFPASQRSYRAHVVRLATDGIGLEWEEFSPALSALPPPGLQLQQPSERPVLTTLQTRG